MTKTVLLYGDSLFWGLNPATGKRHEREDRVSTQVQAALQQAEVINEGLRGRTMFGENGYFPQRDGQDQFGPIFASHLPIDLVTIMLGTNDLNAKTQHSAEDIAVSVPRYVEQMQSWCDFMGYPLPKVLVVSPTDIDASSLTKFAEVFAGASEKVAPAVAALEHLSQEQGYEFLDARSVARSINGDGIHLDPEESRKLGIAIGEKIAAMLT